MGTGAVHSMSNPKNVALHRAQLGSTYQILESELGMHSKSWLRGRRPPVFGAGDGAVFAVVLASKDE